MNKTVDSQPHPLPSRHSVKPSDPDYNRVSFEYLKARCIVQPNGCWEMQGFRQYSKGMTHAGYGQFAFRGGNWRAHRVAYTIAKGEIPKGYVVAHRCDNTPCCNPDHLVAMTELENAADMIAKRRNFEQRRTHCPYGHEYSDENTEYKRAKSGRLARECRICIKAREQSPKYIEARRARQRRYRIEKRVARQEGLR